MKMKSTFIAATLLLVSVMTEGGLSAQNPIVQTCFTTDPAPMVHDGIEYADMQVIGEAYDILRRGLGMDAEEIGEDRKSTRLNSSH